MKKSERAFKMQYNFKKNNEHVKIRQCTLDININMRHVDTEKLQQT